MKWIIQISCPNLAPEVEGERIKFTGIFYSKNCACVRASSIGRNDTNNVYVHATVGVSFWHTGNTICIRVSSAGNWSMLSICMRTKSESSGTTTTAVVWWWWWDATAAPSHVVPFLLVNCSSITKIAQENECEQWCFGWHWGRMNVEWPPLKTTTTDDRWQLMIGRRWRRS